MLHAPPARPDEPMTATLICQAGALGLAALAFGAVVLLNAEGIAAAFGLVG